MRHDMTTLARGGDRKKKGVRHIARHITRHVARHIIWTLSFLCLGLTGSAAADEPPADHTAPGAVCLQTAWDRFSAKDLSGKTWETGSMGNRVTIIHFWATWCPPCRKEIEYLREIYNDYRGRGLDIIGINVEGIERADLTRFLAGMRVDWPQIHERGALQGRLARLFGITRLPGAFIVDQQGTIRQLHAADARTLREAVESALPQGDM
jgi:thiol-disulfide isomerase/thioredoxin